MKHVADRLCTVGTKLEKLPHYVDLEQRRTCDPRRIKALQQARVYIRRATNNVQQALDTIEQAVPGIDGFRL